MTTNVRKIYEDRKGIFQYYFQFIFRSASNVVENKKIHNTLTLRLKLKRVQFLFYSYLLRLSLSDRVEGKQV